MSRRIILLTMQMNRRSSSNSSSSSSSSSISSTNQQRTTMQLSSSETIITRRRMKNNTSSSFRKASNYLLLLVVVVLLLFKLSSVTSSFVLPKNTENDSLRTTATTPTNNNRIIRTIRSTTTITAKQQQQEQPENEPTKLQEIWDRVYNTYVNRIRRNKTKDTTDSTPTTTTNINKQKKKKESESYNDDTTNIISIPTIPEPIFPTLNRTMEMAKLSALVYKFHTEMNDTYICEELINNKLVLYNNTTEESYRIPTAWDDLYCYWYYHDRTTTGTQVLLVSSIQYNYIAIVFAGTDDTTTALTDIDILMKPYGPVDTTTTPTTPTTKKEQQEKNGNNNDDTIVDPRYALYNNISLPPFSDPTTPTDNNNTTTSSIIKVHAGFNYALFHNNLMGEIITRVEDILLQLHDTSPTIRLLTTGHSLGGASSILTAVGLQLHFQQYYNTTTTNNNSAVPLYNTTTNPITSITFGAPRMGNNAWYEYITTHESMRSVQLWRIVLGWDLVPRLPALMTHVGHTIQLQYITWYNNYTIIPSLTTTTTTTKERQEKDIKRKVEIDSCNGSMDCEYKAEQDEQIQLIQAYRNLNNNSNNNETTTTVATSWFGPDWWDDWDNYSSWWDDWGNYNSSSGNNNSTEYPQSIAYYNHYGNVTIGYAGVPFGWFTKSYLWVPGALWSHSVDRYLLFLRSIQQYDDNNNNNNNNNSTNNSNQTTVTTSNNNETGSIWVHEFVRIDDNSTNKNITPTPPNNDDDWTHPLPNDDDIIHIE